MVSSNKNNNVSYQTTIKQLGYQHFKGLQSDVIDNVFFLLEQPLTYPKLYICWLCYYSLKRSGDTSHVFCKCYIKYRQTFSNKISLVSFLSLRYYLYFLIIKWQLMLKTIYTCASKMHNSFTFIYIYMYIRY